MTQRASLSAAIESVLDDDGRPLCAVPDDCDVCRPYGLQRPGETRAAWLARITAGVEGSEMSLDKSDAVSVALAVLEGGD